MEQGEKNEDIHLGSSLGRWQMTGTKFIALNLDLGTLLCDFLPKVVIVELSEYRGSGSGGKQERVNRGSEGGGGV